MTICEVHEKLDYACRQCYRGGCSAVEHVVDTAIEEAAAAEREACAVLCDEIARGNYREVAKLCANAIRHRAGLWDESEAERNLLENELSKSNTRFEHVEEVAPEIAAVARLREDS